MRWRASRRFAASSATACSPALTAGHSLGEYAALVLAGASYVRERVKARKSARRAHERVRSRRHGRDDARFAGGDGARGQALLRYRRPATCLIRPSSPGDTADLERLVAEMATVHPKKRAVRFNTEGAFHTYLMVAAARGFRKVLEETQFSHLATTVLSNYTGKLHEMPPTRSARGCSSSCSIPSVGSGV